MIHFLISDLDKSKRKRTRVWDHTKQLSSTCCQLMAILLFGMAASWGQSPTYGACSYDRDVPWNGEGPNPRDSYHVFTSPEETLNDMRKFGGYPYAGVRICAGNFVHADLLLGAPVSANTWPIIGQATRGICNNLGEVVSTVDVNFEVYGLIQCTPAAPRKIIAIDPGHGFKCAALGMPPGAIGVTDFPNSDPPPGWLREDELTMAIAREFQRLASSKYTVVLTKNSANICPTYKKRGETAKDFKADVFVSVHINARNFIPFNPFANGTSVIYNSSRPAEAKTLANLMAANVSASLGVNNRGAMVDDGLAVLKETVTPMTAVLVESARLSGSDEEKLHAAGSATKVAAGIKAALDAFFGN